MHYFNGKVFWTYVVMCLAASSADSLDHVGGVWSDFLRGVYNGVALIVLLNMVVKRAEQDR